MNDVRPSNQRLAGLSKYARDWLNNLRRESGGYPAEVLRHINILEEDVARAERISDHLGEERSRLRAALERYGRHEHPNCYDLTLKEDGSFGPRNGCLCGFDAAKGEGSPDETSRDVDDAARWRFARDAMCYSFDGQDRTHYLKASGRESFEETVDRRRAVEPTPKPTRDADHCDYPDCEQHWTHVVAKARALLEPLADCDPAIRQWLKTADLPSLPFEKASAHIVGYRCSNWPCQLLRFHDGPCITAENGECKP